MTKYAALWAADAGTYALVINPFFAASVGFLALQALAWQIVLRHFTLSFSYLFTSLTYPLVLFFSAFLFAEKITIMNLAGTAVIVAGILLIIKGEAPADE